MRSGENYVYFDAKGSEKVGKSGRNVADLDVARRYVF